MNAAFLVKVLLVFTLSIIGITQVKSQHAVGAKISTELLAYDYKPHPMLRPSKAGNLALSFSGQFGAYYVNTFSNKVSFSAGVDYTFKDYFINNQYGFLEIFGLIGMAFLGVQHEFDSVAVQKIEIRSHYIEMNSGVRYYIKPYADYRPNWFISGSISGLVDLKDEIEVEHLAGTTVLNQEIKEHIKKDITEIIGIARLGFGFEFPFIQNVHLNGVLDLLNFYFNNLHPEITDMGSGLRLTFGVTVYL